MLLVLADEFSGAADIAGIAWRYGLKTEVRHEIPSCSTSDVLVIDTHTRGLNVIEAISKTRDIFRKVKQHFPEALIFKKVDSTCRGHIIAEINACLEEIPYEQVLLLPANPSQNRHIRKGKYYANGYAIHETEFAKDPQYPISSYDIGELMNLNASRLAWVHFERNRRFPTGNALITADLLTVKDFEKSLNQLQANYLICGGVDCFEAWLVKCNIPRRIEITESKMNLKLDANLAIEGSSLTSSFPKGDLS